MCCYRHLAADHLGTLSGLCKCHCWPLVHFVGFSGAESVMLLDLCVAAAAAATAAGSTVVGYCYCYYRYCLALYLRMVPIY